MMKRDIPTSRAEILGDCAAAFGMMTRLPIPVDTGYAFARGAATAWAYPVAGAFVGACAAITATFATTIGLPAGLAAAGALGAQIILTGAMHEDGLADSADGFWGGWTKARRLEIMKDSHIGTYGVIALVLGILIRWLAITALIGAGMTVVGLITVAALSRVPMAALMGWLPSARESGLSKSVGAPDQNTVILGALIGFSVAILCLGFWAIPLALTGAAAAAICARLALAKIGGQTGDILGATQQLTEMSLLLCLVVLAA